MPQQLMHPPHVTGLPLFSLSLCEVLAEILLNVGNKERGLHLLRHTKFILSVLDLI